MFGHHLELSLDVISGSGIGGQLNVVEILNVRDLVLVVVVHKGNVLAVVGPTVRTKVDTKAIRVCGGVEEGTVEALEECKFASGLSKSTELEPLLAGQYV